MKEIRAFLFLFGWYNLSHSSQPPQPAANAQQIQQMPLENLLQVVNPVQHQPQGLTPFQIWLAAQAEAQSNN